MILSSSPQDLRRSMGAGGLLDGLACGLLCSLGQHAPVHLVLGIFQLLVPDAIVSAVHFGRLPVQHLQPASYLWPPSISSEC